MLLGARHPVPQTRTLGRSRQEDFLSCLVLCSLRRHIRVGPRAPLLVERGAHLPALQRLRRAVVAQQEGGRLALRGAQERAEGGQLWGREAVSVCRASRVSPVPAQAAEKHIPSPLPGAENTAGRMS